METLSEQTRDLLHGAVKGSLLPSLHFASESGERTAFVLGPKVQGVYSLMDTY